MEMNTASLRELPKPPQMGDIGICGGCGWIMIYVDAFSVRNPGKEEGRLIWQNAEILAIRQSMLDRL